LGVALKTAAKQAVVVQGSLAHKKQRPHLGPPQGPTQSPTVGSWGGAASHQRGNPVHTLARQLVVTSYYWEGTLVLWFGNSLAERHCQYILRNKGVGRRQRGTNSLDWIFRCRTYRGTSLIRNRVLLGPCSRHRTRALRKS
jgi:hypothetical protein